MKTMTKDKADLKITIKKKGSEPLTFDLWELIAVCWDYIHELERQNPQTAEDFRECDFLDTLMQNYFTCKMIHNEFNKDLTNDMEDVEGFITKYLRRFFASMHLEELNNLPPAILIED